MVADKSDLRMVMANHPEDGWLEPDEPSLDPVSFLRLLRMRWLWLVVALLVGSAVGYLLGNSVAGNYTASVPLQPVIDSGEETATAFDAATESLIYELETDHFLSELRGISGDGVQRVGVSAPETASIVVVSVIADTPQVAERGARGVAELLGRDQTDLASSAREAELEALQARVERYDQRIAEITAQLGNAGEAVPPGEETVGEGFLSEQIRRRADVLDQIDSIELELTQSSSGFEAFALDAIVAEPAQPTKGVVMGLSAIAFALLACGAIFVSGLRGAGAAVPPLLRARFNLPITDVTSGFEISALAGRITRHHYRKVGVVAVGSRSTEESRPVVDELTAAIRASGSKVGVVDHDLREREGTHKHRHGRTVGLAAYYMGRIDADHFVAQAAEDTGTGPRGSTVLRRGELDEPTISRLDPERTSDLLAAVLRVADVCLMASADPNVIREAAPVVSQLDAVLVVVRTATDIRTVEEFLGKLAAAGVEPLALGTLPRSRGRNIRFRWDIAPGA